MTRERDGSGLAVGIEIRAVQKMDRKGLAGLRGARSRSKLSVTEEPGLAATPVSRLAPPLPTTSISDSAPPCDCATSSPSQLASVAFM